MHALRVSSCCDEQLAKGALLDTLVPAGSIHLGSQVRPKAWEWHIRTIIRWTVGRQASKQVWRTRDDHFLGAARYSRTPLAYMPVG